jgi:hypothetical protein
MMREETLSKDDSFKKYHRARIRVQQRLKPVVRTRVKI